MKPCFARPRISGVSCRIVAGVPYGSDKQIIANPGVRDVLSGLPPMIGRLVCGPLVAPDARAVTEATLRDVSVPEFTFWVYDVATRLPMPLFERLPLAVSYANASGNSVEWVRWQRVNSYAEFVAYRKKQYELGFESVIKEDPEGLR